MRITFDLPDELEPQLENEARNDGHTNKSAIIRKAISFYLQSKPRKDKNKHIRAKQSGITAQGKEKTK